MFEAYQPVVQDGAWTFGLLEMWVQKKQWELHCVPHGLLCRQPGAGRSARTAGQGAVLRSGAALRYSRRLVSPIVRGACHQHRRPTVLGRWFPKAKAAKHSVHIPCWGSRPAE